MLSQELMRIFHTQVYFKDHASLWLCYLSCTVLLSYSSKQYSRDKFNVFFKDIKKIKTS